MYSVRKLVMHILKLGRTADITRSLTKNVCSNKMIVMMTCHELYEKKSKFEYQKFTDIQVTKKCAKFQKFQVLM